MHNMEENNERNRLREVHPLVTAGFIADWLVDFTQLLLYYIQYLSP